jgi:hypothetical protein
LAFDPDKVLAEIEQRNRLRKEAQLPLLSIPDELDRLEAVERGREFEQYLGENQKLFWRTFRAIMNRRFRHAVPQRWMESVSAGASTRRLFRQRWAERL